MTYTGTTDVILGAQGEQNVSVLSFRTERQWKVPVQAFNKSPFPRGGTKLTPGVGPHNSHNYPNNYIFQETTYRNIIHTNP